MTVAEHPFYSLQNCVLTPHIAGSEGDEVARMGEYMLDEYRAFASGEPCKYEVTEKMLEKRPSAEGRFYICFIKLSVLAEIGKTERCGSLCVFASLYTGEYKYHHGHNVGNKLQKLFFGRVTVEVVCGNVESRKDK